MTTLGHTGYMTATHLRQLWRQPWWIAVTLVQPVIWLLLFGSLFGVVSDIPGFGTDSYIEYLAPGIVVMTAFFSAGWAGMPLIEDIDRGVTDRLLVTPRQPRCAAGRTGGPAVGDDRDPVPDHRGHRARGRRGLSQRRGGVVALVGIAVLIGAAFTSLSLGFGLTARKEGPDRGGHLPPAPPVVPVLDVHTARADATGCARSRTSIRSSGRWRPLGRRRWASAAGSSWPSRRTPHRIPGPLCLVALRALERYQRSL